MATSHLDDRLTGQYRAENYCSSDEGERDDEGSGGECEPLPVAPSSNDQQMSLEQQAKLSRWEGPKTGPKGVKADYERYKQMQAQERAIDKDKRIKIWKASAMTADPNKHAAAVDEDEDDDFDDDDEFLQEYHQKRLQQMKQQAESFLLEPSFGSLMEINGDAFVNIIDKEDRKVMVVVHIYDSITACMQMNQCLECLAQQYKHVKFCKVNASEACVSLNFKMHALPALQVYKGGVLIGNYIRMTDHLDKHFVANDVENFLIDKDILTPGAAVTATSPVTTKLVNNKVISSAIDDEEDDSDFE